MIRTFSLFVFCLALSAGCKPDPIIGTWEQPIIGRQDAMQGIILKPGGTASSVNMHTLQYETWKRNGNLLILTGKSIGNGQTIEISEEYEIRRIDEKSLELRMGDYVSSFSRKQNQ